MLCRVLVGLAALATATAQRDDIAQLAKLDLKVLAFTPAAKSSIQRRQHIQVTFNRAVIALGSDFTTAPLPSDKTPFTISMAQSHEGSAGKALPIFPGKWRWVTTFVARFDPDSDWPTDVTVTARLNADLRTWDGAALQSEDLADVKTYTTPPLSLYSNSISSAQATALTGGQWSPNIFPSAKGLPNQEMPPDGVMTLSFSRSVVPALLQKHLQLTDAAGTVVGDALTVSDCATAGRWRNNNKCASVTLNTNVKLEVDTEYRLVMPAGSSYNAQCGATQKALSKSFMGLRSFKFPFRQEQVPTYGGLKPATSRYDLWLIHGLDAKVGLEQIKAAITITPAVEINLVRKSLGVLRFEPSSDLSGFKPETTYTITVTGTDAVKDGFGQSLQTHSTKFITAPETTFFHDALDGVSRGTPLVFPTSDPLAADFYAMARGNSYCYSNDYQVRKSGCPGVAAKDAAHIGGANVGTLDQVKLMLAAVHNSYETFIEEDTTAYVDLDPAKKTQIQSLRLDHTKLLGSSGMFMENKWIGGNFDRATSRRSKTTSIVQGDAKLGVTFLATGPDTMTAWVTDITTNAAVQGAVCTVLYASQTNNAARTSVQTVGSGTTDATGMTQFKISSTKSRYNPLYGVVEGGRATTYAANIQLVQGLRLYSVPNTGISGVLITDRAVYKPGDELHLKGYVRGQEGRELVVPTSGYTFTVQWKSGAPAETTDVTLNPATGGFHLSMAIPDDASYGDKSLSLSNGAGSTKITIADPRPPTVLMKLKPGTGETDVLTVPLAGSLDVQVSTRTYAGTAVAGEPITVKWTHQPAPPPPYYGYGPRPSYYYPGGSSVTSSSSGAEPLTGTIDVVTDADGLGVATFKLPAEAVALVSAGDKVKFEAQWIGPTREKVNAETSVVLSNSKWSIQLESSPAQPVPGYEFGSSVTVEELGTEARQDSADVTITLYHDPPALAWCAR
jgi:hypothetical protein